MNTTSYFAIITALNPISHIGKTASTGALFNTEEVIYNGAPAKVPYVTGNSMKGILRRTGMEYMAAMLGLDPEVGGRAGENLAEDNPLTPNRLGLLWNGGILTSDGGRAINVDVAAQLSELIPWLAVVGGCVGNQMIKGRMAAHPLTLVCAENAERLMIMQADVNRQRDGDEPITILNPGDQLAPARAMLQVQEFTHKDDLKDNTVTRYLPQAARQKLLEDQSGKQRQKQEDENYQDTERHTQMRYSIQTIKAMSRFFWRVDFFDLTPLMEDAAKTTLAYFLARPYVGGNARQGHGLISLEWIGWNRVDPAQGEGGHEVSFTIGNLYAQHLQSRRSEIIDTLKILAS